MNTSTFRRVCTSAVVLAAAAALSLGGSTVSSAKTSLWDKPASAVTSASGAHTSVAKSTSMWD